MVRRYYKSIFDELDEMRNYMDSLFHQMYDSDPIALLPPAGGSATKMLPILQFRNGVDVTETKEEVIVTADLISGVTKNDITLNLVNPRALEISWVHSEKKNEDNVGYHLRERRYESMTRIVPLPVPVSENEARASVKNRVLEVHLKKTGKEAKGKIPID